MALADPGFAGDFFNNVAAVAVVIMFTKIVAHRSRKTEWGGVGFLAFLHAAVVIAAVAAVVAALRATDLQQPSGAYHFVAWLGLGIAGGILAADIIIDEFADWKHRKSGKARSSPSGSGGHALERNG